MAFTNSTDNYNLPQYVSTDIPSYLVDQNDAWETIDTNLKEVSDVATAAQTAATSAGSAAAAAQTDATEGKTKANAALNNEADTFSESKTYEVGEYVIYGNVLYICTNAVTVAGSFSGSDWDAVTVGDQLESQSEAISTLNDTIDDITGLIDYNNDCSVTNASTVRLRVNGIPINDTSALVIINMTLVPSATSCVFTLPSSSYGVIINPTLVSLQTNGTNVALELPVNPDQKTVAFTRTGLTVGVVYTLSCAYIHNRAND